MRADEAADKDAIEGESPSSNSALSSCSGPTTREAHAGIYESIHSLFDAYAGAIVRRFERDDAQQRNTIHEQVEALQAQELENGSSLRRCTSAGSLRPAAEGDAGALLCCSQSRSARRSRPSSTPSARHSTCSTRSSSSSSRRASETARAPCRRPRPRSQLFVHRFAFAPVRPRVPAPTPQHLCLLCTPLASYHVAATRLATRPASFTPQLPPPHLYGIPVPALTVSSLSLPPSRCQSRSRSRSAANAASRSRARRAYASR